MTVLNRYLKETIHNQRWECQILEHDDGTFELWEQHGRLDTAKVIKEVSKAISKEEADDYKKRNAEWLIERYKYETK